MRRRRDLEYERDVARRRADDCEREVARLRAALDALPLGVVVLDERWRETFRNQRATAPFGDVGSDALVRGALAGLVGERVAAVRVVDLHGPPPRTVELRVATLPAEAGAVATIEDTSARARLDHVRRDFVANVNHELRTPIGALGVLAEAVQGESDPQVVARLTSRMLAEVARAQSLVEDLLDLSRIEVGDELPAERLSLQEVLDAAVQRVQALADQRQVAVLPRPTDATVPGDRAQLVSAVANLVENAVKYSDDGGTVSIVTDAGDKWVDIAVIDAGVGIPAKDLDRVFERFYRVDRARDRATGGSGLGLSIVRHVAMNHGGEVSVASVEGEGSTFTLRLPK